MAGLIKYENDFIVAGSTSARLSPNFRLSEFSDNNGSIFIHRELIAGLQVLRNRIGTGITIISTSA
ncbi:MAG: hypothetical protein KAI17_21560, partial [Thiotrichaceae bacterium]|nr:hypothetical protein [Thiotrichaceae bacterium]